MAEYLSYISAATPHQAAPLAAENYDQKVRELVAYLRHPSRASGILRASEFLLENLDPSVHSLSYLIVLRNYIRWVQDGDNQQLNKDIYPGGRLWNRAVEFYRCFDPIQIRYAGLEWRQLVELLAQAAQTVSKPFLAVQMISNGLLRLDASSQVLTSVHLVVVKLALTSKSYSHVLPVLDKQQCYLPTISGQVHQKYHQHLLCSEDTPATGFITDVSGFSARLTYREHLQYFLYGAMIYLALKEWDRAIHFLRIAISSPTTNTVSKIMVEAYKKWVLANLLANGKLTSPPQLVSGHVMRVYQSLAKPYISLGDAFERGDISRLASEIELGHSVWYNDNNLGLVYQVISTFEKCVVMKMGRTFSALAVDDVARHIMAYVKPTDRNIEAFVASLSMSGSLDAILLHSCEDKKATMLRFRCGSSASVLREHQMQSRMSGNSSSLGLITSSIERSNYSLDLSDEHFTFHQKHQRWADDGFKSGGIVVDEKKGRLDVDEDIMGEIS